MKVSDILHKRGGAMQVIEKRAFNLLQYLLSDRKLLTKPWIY